MDSQNVFPMLYLLLKKDYEVMRLARKKVINKDELWDAADTIEWVLQAVNFRYKDLQGTMVHVPTLLLVLTPWCADWSDCHLQIFSGSRNWTRDSNSGTSLVAW